MIALISDIHANRFALDAVFEDIDRVGGVEGVFCLGDVVGYGPDPLPCLDLCASRCKRILMGNHEHALIFGAYGFHAAARKAIDWTRDTLQAIDPPSRRKALWQLLENLPVRHEAGDVLLVHGSPRDPVMEYVLESDLWEGADPGKIEQIFELIKRVCFVGHTHRPGVFTEDRCFLPSAELQDGYDISDGGRYLVNVGSVGQPRDRDWRACYTLFSGDAVYFRRVAYDVQAAAERIREVPSLDRRFAERLLRGE